MATLEQHRLKESLGGFVQLLTIDAENISGNPAHKRRFVNHYGEDGTGVAYQGNTFIPHPYEIKSVKRSAKSNRAGAKLSISDNDDVSFTRFIDEVGGSIDGARVYEIKVYERFLDGGIDPNVLAYIKRLDHEVNYVEQSQNGGSLILHTVDPLSKSLVVPSLQFSAGTPNDTRYFPSVFPAADRKITEGRS